MDLFTQLGMQAVSATTLDAVLADSDELTVAYWWGTDCFNCEQFKKQASQQLEALLALKLRWLQANVYDDAELVRRFSLHGVPAFYFFRAGKKLGRVTGWQGLPYFCEVVAQLQLAATVPK
ncbi:thioredoxin family protein [Ampullimonas aquatilis]|uniref:thioredoxin family protein n=1 Tax=Ampullimonas aquatilis TaxID=1341549 RepID=UPI003C76DC59